MKLGDAAPFEGVLLTTPMAAELATKFQQCLGTVDAERARATELIAIEKKACEARLNVIEETSTAKLRVMREALDAAQSKAREEQDKQIMFAVGGSALGVLLGVILGGGTALYLMVVSS